MKILYDLYHAQPIGSSQFHGGGEYIKTIFRFLVLNYSNEHEIEAMYNSDKFIDKWLLNLIEENHVKTYDVKSVEDIAVIVKQSSADCFYSGLAYAYADVHLDATLVRVGTLHGLRSLEAYIDSKTPLYVNGMLRYIKYTIKYLIWKSSGNPYEKRELMKFRNVLSNFDKIITDSTHSQYALRCWLPESKSKTVQVFYCPIKYVDSYESDDNEIELPQKYIMLMGGNRWVKNTARTLESLEKMFDSGMLEGYSVVVCGKLPGAVKRIIRHAERYMLFDYVSPNALEQIYRNCDIFLYLTLNEGFGIPPLEAMMYGKTVVTSPICSLPEVYGDSVYYANPYDQKEIMNRILQAADNKIPVDRIEVRVNALQERQEKDIKRICDFIVGKG